MFRSEETMMDTNEPGIKLKMRFLLLSSPYHTIFSTNTEIHYILTCY